MLSKSSEYRNKGLYIDLSSTPVIRKSFLCTKLKSEWIKDLNNIKSGALTLTEEKVRNSLKHIRTGENLLNRTSVLQALRLIIHKGDLLNQKGCVKQKHLQ